METERCRSLGNKKFDFLDIKQFQYCARYGYGLMDAGALVVEAEAWKRANKHLPDQLSYKKSVVPGGKKSLEGQEVTYSFNVDTSDSGDELIERLEHVTCIISAKVNGRRGNVRFFIQSPSGKDYFQVGFANFQAQNQ